MLGKAWSHNRTSNSNGILNTYCDSPLYWNWLSSCLPLYKWSLNAYLVVMVNNAMQNHNRLLHSRRRHNQSFLTKYKYTVVHFPCYASIVGKYPPKDTHRDAERRADIHQQIFLKMKSIMHSGTVEQFIQEYDDFKRSGIEVNYIINSY